MSTEKVIALGSYFEHKMLKQADGVMDWYHLGLDVLGFIPGFGEPLDAANAFTYIVEGDYTFALLSIISMIPELGDVIGKSCKVALWVNKEAMTSAKLTAKFGAKIANTLIEAIKDGFQLFKTNKNRIFTFLKTLEADSKWSKYKSYFPKLFEALEILFNSFNTAEQSLRVS
jgi:hypothetical protein